MLCIRIRGIRRNAFTLTEVAIAILILGIMAAFMTLSTRTARQTAKSEADRIVAQLYRLIETANRKHVSFKVLFDGTEQKDYVRIDWQTPTTSDFYNTGYTELNITKGCSIQNLNNTTMDQSALRYSLKDNGFLPPSMTLQVKGQDESIYYIIIRVPGSRIRTSETKPES